MHATAGRHLVAIVAALMLEALAAPPTPGAPLAKLEAYDVVFTSSSKDEADSIPLGNGATGINLWVEENGDLLFYLAHNDAISEMHRLLKLGRVRVSLSPNPFAKGKPYRQQLRLRDGCCDIAAGAPGEEARLKVLVDSDSQTVYVTGSSDQPLTVTATLENWRTARNDLREQGSIASTTIYRGGKPPMTVPTWESPDVILKRPNEVTWYHRNAHTPVPLHIEGQHLKKDAPVVDPIKDRHFGATLFGKDFVARNQTTLALSSPACAFDLRLVTRSEQRPMTDDFLAGLRQQVQQSLDAAEAAQRTAQWWKAFWSRSWIFVSGTPTAPAMPSTQEKMKGKLMKAPTAEDLQNLTRAYALVKYQFACQERSTLPAHFDGGIFNVAPDFAAGRIDPRGKNFTADFRFHGPSLWWQNTRFLYQLHLAQGNFDLMDALFNFYFDREPTFAAKARLFDHTQGIYMNETLALFGLPGMSQFGWGASEFSEGYTRNIWQQCLELGALALDRYDYTGDEALLKKAVPWCDLSLMFYDTHFQRDARGKMVIHPTHALETYWKDVTNDMPSVAGLDEITRRLLDLPERLTTPEQRADWQRIRAAIPDLPRKKNKEGLMVPDSAEQYDPQRFNFEAPDLYCVYPFRLYGVGRTAHDIEEARRAWRSMASPHHFCWFQTGVLAARLGLTEGAKEDVLLRCAARLEVLGQRGHKFRFPGFFGSAFDWPPDYDGAGNMANTLQEMLV